MSNVEPITAMIRPTVADYDPRDLDPTFLPFVKDKGKGKKKRRSYWEVKSTGSYALDSAIGCTCAIELMQYIAMIPSASWLFSIVMEAANKSNKNESIRNNFMAVIGELALVGTAARAKGITVDIAVEGGAE